MLRTAAVPRSIFGRAGLWPRLSLPLGYSPLLDQHRGLAAIAFGSWEDLRRVREAAPLDAEELVAMEEILLLPVGRRVRKSWSPHLTPVLQAWEFSLEQRHGPYRRAMRKIGNWDTADVFARRPDVSRTHFAEHRQIQEVILLAKEEALAGRLSIAEGLAAEAQHLGDPRSHLNLYAQDLEHLAAFAQGESGHHRFRYFDHFRSPVGQPPQDLPLLLQLLPLLSLRRDIALPEIAGFVERVADRFGSPRLRFHAQSWQIAASSRGATRTVAQRISGHYELAQNAAPGLRALPAFLEGVARSDASVLRDAERSARLSGQIWLQLAALAGLLGLAADQHQARRFVRLLELTGWRRLPLIAQDRIGSLALRLTEGGSRSSALVQLAESSGESAPAVQVARMHAEDRSEDRSTRLSGIRALGRSGTEEGTRVLRALSEGVDDVAGDARAELKQRRGRSGLSDRELEVLGLVGRGLTNRQIASTLVLSEHTVARHIANSSAKLGAPNRSAAAALAAAQDERNPRRPPTSRP